MIKVNQAIRMASQKKLDNLLANLDIVDHHLIREYDRSKVTSIRMAK